MVLSSLFRRSDSSAAASAADGASADELRGRARRRLLGAVVLLGLGVLAFPLLFETAPRPIPVDLPIEIPRKDQVPALAMPASAPRAEEAAKPRPAEPEPVAAPAAAAASVAPVVAPPEPVPAPKEAAGPAPAEVKPRPADDGARARALLEGKAAAAEAQAGRWVVQIGAFAEDRTVRDARAKADKAGLATYTQVITAQAGKRTRVRVGPFGDRSEADAVADKLKQAGLPATVLKL